MIRRLFCVHHNVCLGRGRACFPLIRLAEVSDFFSGTGYPTAPVLNILQEHMGETSEGKETQWQD